MDPLVSILIPAFNAQSWLADSVRSAISQSWPRKEIVIVDDGSTDQTLNIARQFEARNVAIISKSNQGAAAARNTAFAACQGDYIQWLDADDLLAPDKVAAQMSVVTRGAAGLRTLLSSSWGTFIYRPHRGRFVPTLLWCDLSPAEWVFRKLKYNIYMQTASWLVTRQLTEAAGPWDTRLLGDDDGEYFCRVLLASENIRFVPEARVFYRMSGANRLSHIGQSKRKMEAHVLSMEMHLRYAAALGPEDRMRDACMQYLETWLGHFYPEQPVLCGKVLQMAETLGGKLTVPPLPWKYRWIEKILGRKAAKRVQLLWSMLRWALISTTDRLLCHFDHPRLGPRFLSQQ